MPENSGLADGMFCVVCVVELPHRSSCSQFVVYWRFGVAGFEWCSFCRLKHNSLVIQQHSRKLLKTDILMSETC